VFATIRDVREIQNKMARTAPARRAKRPAPETSIVYADVLGTRMITPHMIRITLRSDEFAGWITDVPDQFITFIFPPDGADRAKPAVRKDFTWDQWSTMPPEERVHANNYTVRAWRPETLEVDVDIVLHEGSTKGMDWARTTGAGEVLAIWGPRVAYNPPPGMEWLLLFGDDTAIPGIAVILETLEASVSAEVLIEVDSTEDEQPLTTRDGVTVRWFHRNGAHPGTGSALLDAIRELPIPPNANYAWGAGELRMTTAVGKYLRRECGFRPVDVTAVGYWHLESDRH
jgi:NADPH-dependent ferric siderophore reductase